MDIGVLRGVITLLTMAAFAAICWWAYRSGNRERFERDALLPFDDDDEADDVEPTEDAR
jgi:cytochrome c oxidase cbb3-type subunit 4